MMTTTVSHNRVTRYRVVLAVLEVSTMFSGVKFLLRSEGDPTVYWEL